MTIFDARDTIPQTWLERMRTSMLIKNSDRVDAAQFGNASMGKSQS